MRTGRRTFARSAARVKGRRRRGKLRRRGRGAVRSGFRRRRSGRRHGRETQLRNDPAPEATAVETAPPELPKGVNVIGFVRAEKGIGEVCRITAGALETTHIPFGMIDYDVSNTRALDLTWAHRETAEASYRVNLFVMNGDTLQSAYRHFGPPLFDRRYNIGYWVWELPDFPEELCDSFRLVNEVWVPSQFTQDSIARKSPVPVVRIPYPIQVSPPPPLGREAFGLPQHPFLFLTMFDTHSMQERKNPQAALEAFMMAFGQNDPAVGLVVKINNSTAFPEKIAALKAMVQGHRNIYFIEQTIGRQEVNALLDAADCFVSLHHAEGFGLGIAEAMYLGKPVIATNWSGNTDFMNPANSCPVNYTLAQIGSDIGPYKAHQFWAMPDLPHAAYYMRKLVHEHDWRTTIAAMGRQTVHQYFSPAAVGQMIKQRLARMGLVS